MRGRADDQLPLFRVFSVGDRIRPDHPLRDAKRRADRLLAGMSAALAKADGATGRPSVPPERPLKALLLMALCPVRLALNPYASRSTAQWDPTAPSTVARSSARPRSGPPPAG